VHQEVAWGVVRHWFFYLLMPGSRDVVRHFFWGVGGGYLALWIITQKRLILGKGGRASMHLIEEAFAICAADGDGAAGGDRLFVIE
jgi:hypothetical protein